MRFFQSRVMVLCSRVYNFRSIYIDNSYLWGSNITGHILKWIYMPSNKTSLCHLMQIIKIHPQKKIFKKARRDLHILNILGPGRKTPKAFLCTCLPTPISLFPLVIEIQPCPPCLWLSGPQSLLAGRYPGWSVRESLQDGTETFHLRKAREG